jgi:arylformamidase
MRVFRQYDQAGLEAQYDGAVREPALAAKRDARAQRTEAQAARVRREARALLDLAYGAHPRELIDVFQPAAAGGPLLAFIHGGYWRQRSKLEFAWMAPAFTARGITLATIGYPLCPEVRIGDIIGSCRQALLRLHRDAAALGFDAARIHVAGHSAGGHLTAMMAATDFAASGGPAGLVASATCISGLYDLEPLSMVKVNADLKIGKADIAGLSPVRLTPRAGLPVNLSVGNREGEEFLRNTVELGEAWHGRGAHVTMIEADHRYHFDILDDFATPGQPLFEQVMATIGTP